MKKYDLKPFDMKAFKDGAVALSDDKKMLAKYVCEVSDYQYPVIAAYFPSTYLFLNEAYISKAHMEITTEQGYYSEDEDDPLNLTYIVDGMTDFDLPLICVGYIGFRLHYIGSRSSN